MFIENSLAGCVLLCGDDSVEGRVGGETEICPGVSGFCPVLAGILSRFVLVFVPLWPESKGETERTGSQLSGENSVKIDGDSGVVSSVVPRCSARITGLAREPDGDKHTDREARIKGSLFSWEWMKFSGEHDGFMFVAIL